MKADTAIRAEVIDNYSSPSNQSEITMWPKSITECINTRLNSTYAYPTCLTN